MHALTPAQLDQLISSDAAMHLSDAARERLGWIAYFVRHGFSVSETCVHLKISRSTFHRWLERFDPADLTSLEEKSHVPHAPRTAIVPDTVVSLIRAYRHAHPLMGKERIQELLFSEHQLTVSASTVGRVIERECLYFAATPLHWKKRMHLEPHTPTAPKQIAKEIMTDTDNTAANAHHCMRCKVTCMPWRKMLITASIMINIAIAALFVATATWESKSVTAQVSGQQTETTNTISSLDRP